MVLVNTTEVKHLSDRHTARVVAQSGPFRLVLSCYAGSAAAAEKRFLIMERRRIDELGGEAWSEILVASPGSSCAENHAEYLREMADALLVDWPESEEEA